MTLEIHVDPADGCPVMVVTSETPLDEETILAFCKPWPVIDAAAGSLPRCMGCDVHQSLGGTVVQRRLMFKPAPNPQPRAAGYMDRLKTDVDRLGELLSDQHPGLVTWSEAVHRRWKSIAELFYA